MLLIGDRALFGLRLSASGRRLAVTGDELGTRLSPDPAGRSGVMRIRQPPMRMTSAISGRRSRNGDSPGTGKCELKSASEGGLESRPLSAPLGHSRSAIWHRRAIKETN